MARYFVWRWSNENVLAVSNGEIKSWVKPQLGSVFTRHVADQILKLLSPTDKMTRICKLWSGYLPPCQISENSKPQTNKHYITVTVISPKK